MTDDRPPTGQGTAQGAASVSEHGAADADWDACLREMEADVTALEAALNDASGQSIVEPDAWVPPAGLGELPDHLRERALGLLERQLRAAEALVTQITMSKRQREVVTRMSTGPGRPAAAYFDQAL